MKKLFVLVPFIVVASMSYSADFDGGIEKATVPIIVDDKGYFLNAEGLLEEAGPNDPKIHGEYTIFIDETATVKDLIRALYDEPSLFEDTKTGKLVQGLAITELSRGGLGTTRCFLRINPNTVLKTLGIRNGQLNYKLRAELGSIKHTPDVYKDPARAYYERFSGAYIKGSEE